MAWTTLFRKIILWWSSNDVYRNCSVNTSDRPGSHFMNLNATCAIETYGIPWLTHCKRSKPVLDCTNQSMLQQVWARWLGVENLRRHKTCSVLHCLCCQWTSLDLHALTIVKSLNPVGMKYSTATSDSWISPLHYTWAIVMLLEWAASDLPRATGKSKNCAVPGNLKISPCHLSLDTYN